MGFGNMENKLEYILISKITSIILKDKICLKNSYANIYKLMI